MPQATCDGAGRADGLAAYTAGGIVRALPYPVMLIGLDDSVREWNEAASALYEIPADSALGHQFGDLDISYRAEGLRARIEDVKRVVVSVRLENVILGPVPARPSTSTSG